MANPCSTTHASSLFSFFLLLISIAATPVAAQDVASVNIAREITVVTAVTIAVTIAVTVLVCVCAHCGPNLIMRGWRRKSKPKPEPEKPAEHDRLEV
ncbi:hypothetical protein DL770_005746 [Monosporascus sp. CRB-9-2]|nr:hypothetical protein DL770_005746 [Monosporascus sp. CRB-9-2]